MKYKRVLLILFIALAKSVTSQDSLDFISDANTYREILSSKHRNAFTRIGEAEFNERIDSLIALIPSIENDQFTTELLKINSFIEDEHTIIFPNSKMEIPFTFERFDEGMMIVGADSLNQKYLLHRVLSIDDTPWVTVNSMYRSIIKRDNPSYFKFLQTYYFNNPEILKGLGIISDPQVIKFELLSSKGDTVKTTIRSIEISSKKRWVKAPQFKNLLAYSKNNNYWYHYLKESKTLYFNYMNCREDDIKPFIEFNKELFQTIENENPNKIILDLRFNSGGSSSILSPFIKNMIQNKLNNKDRFFVLIGRKVMSSSLMNAIELKKKTQATFIGEETGGNINHFGELKTYQLPYSKIRFTYSTKRWEIWEDHDGAFTPDIEVTNSLFDFIRSNDKALSTALQK